MEITERVFYETYTLTSPTLQDKFWHNWCVILVRYCQLNIELLIIWRKMVGDFCFIFYKLCATSLLLGFTFIKYSMYSVAFVCHYYIPETIHMYVKITLNILFIHCKIGKRLIQPKCPFVRLAIWPYPYSEKGIIDHWSQLTELSRIQWSPISPDQNILNTSSLSSISKISYEWPGNLWTSWSSNKSQITHLFFKPNSEDDVCCLHSTFGILTQSRITIQRFNDLILPSQIKMPINIYLSVCWLVRTKPHPHPPTVTVPSAQCGHNSGQTNCDKCQFFLLTPSLI